KPDALILGKALGGGILPVSMLLARRDVMEVFTPGDHGSTFGGNPLAAAVGLEALNILIDEDLAANSAAMGDDLINQLRAIDTPLVLEIRGKGLFIGVEIDPGYATARDVCKALMKRGLLSKETHDTVVRLAPPLVISKAEIDWAVIQIRDVLDELNPQRLAS
ncbi:MAG: aminotransferase class III-fold pyridoxal phosphate-dependent enzyme, partial [Woeseiaceae bacterium]